MDINEILNKLNNLEKIIGINDDIATKNAENIEKFLSQVRQVVDTKIMQKLQLNNNLTAGEGVKVKYNEAGIIIDSKELTADDIPTIPTSKIKNLNKFLDISEKKILKNLENLEKEIKKTIDENKKEISKNLEIKETQIKSINPLIETQKKEIQILQKAIITLSKKEVKAEDIVNLINELPTNNDKYKIDASHIKNLVNNTMVLGGGMSGSGGGAWGFITGNLNDQNDLKNALLTKEDKSNKNVAGGYVGLDANARINPSQLPSIAIVDTFVVNSQSAMLALDAQTGDVAIRTDISKSYILQGVNPGALSDWQELLTPTDSVNSVFGRTGTVTAQSNDYSASQISNTPTGNIASTNVQNAINELDTSTVRLTGNQTIAGNKTFTDNINTTNIQATTSSGIHLKNTSGNDLIIGGAGGGVNITLYGNTSLNNTNKIVNSADPTNPQDLATKAYVDANAGASEWNPYTSTDWENMEIKKSWIIREAVLVPSGNRISDTLEANSFGATLISSGGGSITAWAAETFGKPYLKLTASCNAGTQFDVFTNSLIPTQGVNGISTPYSMIGRFIWEKGGSSDTNYGRGVYVGDGPFASATTQTGAYLGATVRIFGSNQLQIVHAGSVINTGLTVPNQTDTIETIIYVHNNNTGRVANRINQGAWVFHNVTLGFSSSARREFGFGSRAVNTGGVISVARMEGYVLNRIFTA